MTLFKRKQYNHTVRSAAYNPIRKLPDNTENEKKLKIKALKNFIREEEIFLEETESTYGLKRSLKLDAAKNTLSNLEHPRAGHSGLQINFFLTATEFRFPESSTATANSSAADLSLAGLHISR